MIIQWISKLFQKKPIVERQNELKPSVKTPKSYLDYDWSVVINFETGGQSYYNRFLKKATWPGGASGITIGIGADLGYMTKTEFETFFSRYFTPQENVKLRNVIGLKGVIARDNLNSVKNVEFSWENATEVFKIWTLPKFWKLANGIWPKMNELCENAQIALVSIVFNRGASLKGPTRIEMLRIQSLVLEKKYYEISKEIVSMKRLWVGKGLDGLLKRRDVEAKMVLSCL
jgi:GH24 family phage-related lysozyme (muramidase)